jgi:hypothetical protein
MSAGMQEAARWTLGAKPRIDAALLAATQEGFILLEQTA